MSDFSDDEGFAAAVAQTTTHQERKESTNWSCLQVHPDQAQNPLLLLLSETPYQLNGELTCDFAPSPQVGIIYLSLKYYHYRPKYVEERLSKMAPLRVKVLLLSVDAENADLAARHLSVMCTKLACTLLVGFNQHECAQYIQYFKRLEHKPVDWLRPTLAEEDRLAKVLSAARGVNSTDAAKLTAKFGSLAKLATATKKEIESCPGLGAAKAERLVALFNTPFKTVSNFSKLNF